MHKGPEISDERKALYYIGAVVIGAGILLFVSNFFFIARGPEHPFDMSYNPMPGMVARALGGMALMVIGGALRTVGARGAAGSGLVLDPRQARQDLKPWAQTAGGLVKDALDEVNPSLEAPAETVVKVRCPKCRALNDEDAKFCKQCGGTL
jgi:hypothetical protein